MRCGSHQHPLSLLYNSSFVQIKPPTTSFPRSSLKYARGLLYRKAPGQPVTDRKNSITMADTECIYDQVRQLVAVSPKRTQYDSKENVVFVFNMPLLVGGGPYEVEFKGQRHCLRVPAMLLNSCTLQAQAPVYYPPECTTVSIYDKLKQHETSIAHCSFEFFSRSQLLHEVLEKASDPDMLLCDSLGISTADIKMFDDVMARKVQEKALDGFSLLKITQERVPPVSHTRYPTLLHFGATYGLPLTVAACLRYCPAALQACALKNVDGMSPIEIARKHGRHEITKHLQDFQSNEHGFENNTELRKEEVNNCNEDKEDIYMLMGPNTASDKDDRQYDYVRMPGTGVNTNQIQMTPELQSAISVAETAVSESWLKGELGEEALNAFRQLIENGTTENVDDSSLLYDVPRDLGPALPPKSNRLDQKRHSIHDIPNSAPPLPPRSPRSPRSPLFFVGDQGERRGSDPNIFHRLQPHFDKLSVCEETAVQQPGSPHPPQLPARHKCPLSARGFGGLTNEWRGSDPNLSHRVRNTSTFGSLNDARGSLTLPLKPTQGMQRQPDGFLRPKSCSIDATSMGLSPRLPPRSPRGPRTRSTSCDPDIPVHNVARNRTLSETR